AGVPDDAWSDEGFSRPDALYVALDLWPENDVNVQLYYSNVDAGYSTYYSSIHPYYELLESRTQNTGYAWERWLNNPLVAENLEAVGATVSFEIAGCPTDVFYNFLLSRDIGWNEDDPAYDQLFGARLTKEVADGVNITFVYAHQEPNGDLPGEPGFGEFGIPEDLAGISNVYISEFRDGAPWFSSALPALDLFMAQLEIAY
ncbi:MAG: hypothetical protein ACE5O2_13440, partial [Armatimonadota bacterium]